MQRAFLNQRRNYTSVSFIAPLLAKKMSNGHKPSIKTIAQLVPQLTYDLHKGDCGRISIVGGCEEYTGAPYFVSSTTLRMGADLAYVICEKDAGSVIKTYSPDLIVAPYLRSEDKKHERTLEQINEKVIDVLDKCHCVSIGSGLGTDPYMLKSVKRIITYAKGIELPIVLDADSLGIVAEDPGIIRGYKNAVLTPNFPEFSRLAEALNIDIDGKSPSEATEAVANALGGCTVVRKGKSDIITNGKLLYVCDEKGGLRRCGGQGDVLSGTIATFLAWGEKYKGQAWQHDNQIPHQEIPLLAAFGGCTVTRHASHLAYDECERATQSSSILEQVDSAFDNKFETALKSITKPKM